MIMKTEVFWTSQVWTEVNTFEKISVSDLSKRVNFKNPDGRITIVLFDNCYTFNFLEFDIRMLPKGAYNVIVLKNFNSFTFCQVDVLAKIVWEETDTLDKAWKATHSVLFPDD